MSVIKLICAIKGIMLDRYEKYSILTDSSSLITPSNKLRTYCKFKHNFENYLSANVDRSIVSKFTKLRISNHRLVVEAGRYS